MDILVFDNNYLDNLFKDNSKDLNKYNLIKEIIKNYCHNYVNFIYNVLLVYNNTYVNIIDKESNLDNTDINSIISKLLKYKKDITVTNIVVSDVYDVLYNLPMDRYSFNSDLYDFIYFSLERIKNNTHNKLNNKEILENLESIMDILSDVFTIIDSNILNCIFRKKEDFNGNVVIYLEIFSNRLFLNMVV